MAKNVFHRLEFKYILNIEQYNAIISTIREIMNHDEYGDKTIQSLYFDTPNYRLIRESIEKPYFKEKLRLRSYGLINKDSEVFLEMKRKSEKVVYKRRVKVTEDEAFDFISNKTDGDDDQISKELKYFRDYYQNLEPKILLLYDREAYNLDRLRVTFDTNIRYRLNDLNLSTSLEGNLLDEGLIMMEVKTIHSIPLWLVKLLSDNHIYKTSYSKYGTAYKKIILKTLNN